MKSKETVLYPHIVIKRLSIFLVCIFAFFVTTKINAQTTKQDTFQKSVGIDATFINNFLPFDNTIGKRGDYLLHYFKYKDNGRFVRHAFDIDIFGSFQNNADDSANNDARFNIDYKVSRGKKRKIFKNGYLHYGVEIHFGYFLNQRTNQDQTDPSGESLNINTDHSLEILLGPFLGLQYKFSPRISIYTEGGFYLLTDLARNTFTSEFNSDNDFVETEIIIRDHFDLPGSIILSYHF